MPMPPHDIMGLCQLDGNMTMTHDPPVSPPHSPSMTLTLTHSIPNQATPPLAIPISSPIVMNNTQSDDISYVK